VRVVGIKSVGMKKRSNGTPLVSLLVLIGR